MQAIAQLLLVDVVRSRMDRLLSVQFALFGGTAAVLQPYERFLELVLHIHQLETGCVHALVTRANARALAVTHASICRCHHTASIGFEYCSQ